MTLGYAIPSCKSYLEYTYRVLDQISKSTILPDTKFELTEDIIFDTITSNLKKINLPNYLENK